MCRRFPQHTDVRALRVPGWNSQSFLKRLAEVSGTVWRHGRLHTGKHEVSSTLLCCQRVSVCLRYAIIAINNAHAAAMAAGNNTVITE